MWQEMYVDIPYDSLIADLQRHHVYTIQKIANDGRPTMSIKLDKAGRIVYYQQEPNYPIDSMVHDDTGALRRYLQTGGDHTGESFEYIWHKRQNQISFERVVTGKDGSKVTDMRVAMFTKNDTAYTLGDNLDGKTVIKRFVEKNGTLHNRMTTYDNGGIQTRLKHDYYIYDNKRRLIEEGEVEEDDELTELFRKAMSDMRNKKKMDTAFLREIYSLQRNPDEATVRKVFKKHNYPFDLGVAKMAGRKAFEYDENNGLLVKCTHLIEGTTYDYTYNGSLRITNVHKKNSFATSDFRYYYNENGLLGGFTIVQIPGSGETYRYTYFPGYGK